MSDIIDKKAASLLQDADAFSAPVDVFGVARFLEIRVQPEMTDDKISGALYRRPDETVIGLNALHPKTRKRFTVAHEIGHFVLHDEEVFIDQVYRRSDQATNSTETEANRFAAALLMPAELVMGEVKQYDPPLRSDHVEEIARRFEVSQQAMTFRLENLGIELQES